MLAARPQPDRAMRMPISGIYKIKGVGDVLAGRIEQGIVKPRGGGLHAHPHPANPCEGKVFTIEMHHKRVDEAKPGDNVGMNIKGLDKINMPRVGDVMIYKKDDSLEACGTSTLRSRPSTSPARSSPATRPSASCAAAAPRASATLVFKVGKETGGKKMESPHSLKSNEVAEVSSSPSTPRRRLFKACEGLARIAFLDGNTAVMLGKITKVEFKEDK